MTTRPACVDLFCGSGGLSEGLKLAGFLPIFAIDFDKNATATYAKNHPETVVITKDIAALDPGEIIDAAKAIEIDLLAGGPSCQGYSTHGKRKAEDPRNFLFEHFIRIAKALRPKWILIENVQGLLTYNQGYFKNVILTKLQALGYHANARILCAADYGVPQFRRRIFFLATRMDVAISFPAPTHSENEKEGLLPYVTVGDALGDLPSLSKSINSSKNGYASKPKGDYQNYVRAGSSFLSLHDARKLSTQAMSIASHVKEGSGLRSVPVDFLPERFKKMRRISDGSLRKDCTTLYYRLSRNHPAYTITCNFRNIASGPFLHPLENRSLSYREAARLMSFQDSYEFIGSSLARQIGNAVPPLMAKAVGEHIIKLLNSKPHREFESYLATTALTENFECPATLRKIA